MSTRTLGGKTLMMTTHCPLWSQDMEESSCALEASSLLAVFTVTEDATQAAAEGMSPTLLLSGELQELKPCPASQDMPTGTITAQTLRG